MLVHIDNYKKIMAELKAVKVKLIAVSKTKPVAAIQEMYAMGQRAFGENYVQELVDKQAQLPKDIEWHFIGHLQSNKVKYIAPFVHCIHGVDSEKLLSEINKQAAKVGREIFCLLQIHIASEETKFGLNEDECMAIIHNLPAYPHVKVVGLMGMASFTNNFEQVEQEFENINTLKNKLKLPQLSTGMSGDYQIALKHGSTMVRIGSLLFGARSYEN
jgi:hypothetical protein